MFVMIEEIGEDILRDGFDNVKDARNIGLSRVGVDGEGVVVFGLSIVHFGNTFSARGAHNNQKIVLLEQSKIFLVFVVDHS